MGGGGGGDSGIDLHLRPGACLQPGMPCCARHSDHDDDDDGLSLGDARLCPEQACWIYLS